MAHFRKSHVIVWFLFIPKCLEGMEKEVDQTWFSNDSDKSLSLCGGRASPSDLGSVCTGLFCGVVNISGRWLQNSLG